MANSKQGIVIHCSDSRWGTSNDIAQWHRERGWSDVGYHFVICNGNIDGDDKNYLDCMDGSIERGRDIDLSGAHAMGYNATHIGICMIGKGDKELEGFTPKQILSLNTLIQALMQKYDIPVQKIIGHNEVSKKTCPGFDVGLLRSDLRVRD